MSDSTPEQEAAFKKAKEGLDRAAGGDAHAEYRKYVDGGLRDLESLVNP